MTELIERLHDLGSQAPDGGTVERLVRGAVAGGRRRQRRRGVALAAGVVATAAVVAGVVLLARPAGPRPVPVPPADQPVTVGPLRLTAPAGYTATVRQLPDSPEPLWVASLNRPDGTDAVGVAVRVGPTTPITAGTYGAGARAVTIRGHQGVATDGAGGLLREWPETGDTLVTITAVRSDPTTLAATQAVIDSIVSSPEPLQRKKYCYFRPYDPATGQNRDVCFTDPAGEQQYASAHPNG